MKKTTLIATVACVLLAVAGNAQTVVSGTIEGHDYVDLGLSVKWATCNVGASSPEDYGDYFAWGETTTKSTYTEANSKAYNDNTGYISGRPKYDAARANWGGSWRMPTSVEIEELISNCTWTWTTQGDYDGYKVTSKTNGNSIFLPATGWRYGSSLYFAGEDGGYWSSMPELSILRSAYSLYFRSSSRDTYWRYRYYGQCVRPVSK